MNNRLGWHPHLVIWRLTPVIVLATPFLILLIFRLLLLDDYLAFTSDMGSYLMTRNWVLGTDVTSYMPGHYRPPIIGVLLLPFTWVVGDLMGSKLLALLVSILPGIAFFLWMRRYVGAWPAYIGGLLLVSLPFYGTYTAGSYLPLLSYAVLILAYIGVMDRRVPLWMPMLAFFTLAGLNQTTTALFIITAPLIAVSIHPKLLIRLIILALPALIWLPFYINAMPGFNAFTYEGPILVRQFNSLAMVLAAPAVLAFLADKRAAWVTAPSFTLMLVAQLGSYDSALNNLFARAVWLLPVFTIVGLGYIWQARLPHLRLSLADIAILLVVIIGLNLLWFDSFHAKASTNQPLTPDTLAAVEWIKTNTVSEAKVYTHPRGLGWYVGGLAWREWDGTWGGPAPRGFVESQAAFNCAMAWTLDCDPVALKTLGFTHILIDKGAGQTVWGKPEHNGWRLDPPWLKQVFESDDVVIMELK